MGDGDKWYFSKERLEFTPSRKHDVDSARELGYRQQSASFIQDLGQKLQLPQPCINTAIVYMHRFYVSISFVEVQRYSLSTAALFLATKAEDQPRKLEHVIKAAHALLYRKNPHLDVRSEEYTYKLKEIMGHENLLLQILGFDIGIEHPHTYVVKVCQLVKASKDLAQASYIMATASLHLTTMCLQYKPTIVACVCFHFVCKWSGYRISKCSEGRDWFYYVDKDVTWELLERLTDEFIEILERSPHELKRIFRKHGSMHVPRPIDNIPALPGPSDSGNSGASSSTSNRPTAVPIEDKIGSVIKKEKDPSPGPSNAECINDSKEKKPVVVKKEPESSKQEEKTHLSVLPPKPSIPLEHQPTSHHALQIPNEHLLGACNESVKLPQEKLQPPPSALPQHQPQHPRPAVHVPNEHSSSKNSSKETLESSISRKNKWKHASEIKISSSSNNSCNHSEPTSSGIKGKIRRDLISPIGLDCNQKYTPPVKAESPKKPLIIKLLKPPPPVESPKAEKSLTPTSLKIVLTKDKSGSGSYSTSHRSAHRENRKRSHSSDVSDGSHRDHKNSVEPSIKYPKSEQYQKNHSGDQRPNKVSRHNSSHLSDIDNTRNNAWSSRLQYPAVNGNSTFQNYSTVPNYQNSYLIPPPPLPKLKGHNMMVGKASSNFLMQPPLPPHQPPPPPPPPPEDI